MLGVQGHAICVASDGHEGLYALSGNSGRPPSFDIVITEIFMPQGDGFEVIRAAIRLPQHPPILVIDHPFSPATIALRPDYLRMALELGADRVLANPVRLRTFHATVAALLNERAAHPLLRRAV